MQYETRISKRGDVYLRTLLIRNLAVQGDAPTEVLQLIEDIAEILQEVQRDLKQGKPL